MEAEGILFYSRSISSRERPVHFWMIRGVIPSAFILRAVDSFPFCSPFCSPSCNPFSMPSSMEEVRRNLSLSKMTCSLPVLEYADELQSGEEKTYRALVLSNLVAIHQKTGIGRLSAYCGAVSAGAAAGAGIAYLCGGGYEEVIHTVVNALAIVSGMVCDGAKASCAAKIASSVDAGILGYNMYLRGQQFYAGDGIVTKGVEATIQNIGRLGKDGMKETNEEIIKMMISD